MKLQTTVDIQPSAWKIGYEDKILLLGSCFSDEIGEQMKQRYLNVTCNPFGTLYNPISIANAITMNEVPELVLHDGLWHAMSHHGSFSRANEKEARAAVAASVETMQRALEEATVVIVTFGTAWVYEMNGEVVGNCHKLPDSAFTRRRLSVEEIVAAWQPILARYPDKHWLFTVSPIRHIKDGLHENQLSKATLLQAIDELALPFTGEGHCPIGLPVAVRRTLQGVGYFPSYEILLDELRDYRFYADDLVHPSKLAVNCIWERLVDTYCTNQTKNEMMLQHKRWKQTQHIPLHENNNP